LISIIDLLTHPLVVIVFIWIIAGVIGAMYLRRSRTKIAKVKGPLMKQIGKMIGETEKAKGLSVPAVRSRQEIITQMFESQMHAIDLEPSTDSGYIPVSHTPLARFLKQRGVPDDTIGAILAGLMEEEHEAEVRAIIEAAADSPDINLVGDELDKAKDLAVEEWKYLHESGKA
jgi:hypothetical protein